MQACEAYNGLGGHIPDDFLFLDVCEKYGKLPSEAEKESSVWIGRMMFKLRVERQAEIDREKDRQANEST